MFMVFLDCMMLILIPKEEAYTADMLNVSMQDHMDEVSKIAHDVKLRLEHLQHANKRALERKASPAAVQTIAALAMHMYLQAQPITDRHVVLCSQSTCGSQHVALIKNLCKLSLL